MCLMRSHAPCPLHHPRLRASPHGWSPCSTWLPCPHPAAPGTPSFAALHQVPARATSVQAARGCKPDCCGGCRHSQTPRGNLSSTLLPNAGWMCMEPAIRSGILGPWPLRLGPPPSAASSSPPRTSALWSGLLCGLHATLLCGSWRPHQTRLQGWRKISYGTFIKYRHRVVRKAAWKAKNHLCPAQDHPLHLLHAESSAAPCASDSSP